MIARLEVRTLGPYRIFLDGQPITDLTSRTAEALLVYLMRQSRPVARDVLADFFWDERGSQRAAANLRTLLTLLRKSLGDYLLITRRTVAFDHSADYWWDLEALERDMAALAPVLARPEAPDVESMRRLDATLALVEGDFLEGFHLSESRGFEEWMSQTQNQVRRLAEHGLARLVEACLQHGEYNAGIEHADRLLMLAPYNEEAHRRMLWLLARSGRRNAALAHHEACRRLLEEELGVGPEEATNEVYRRIRALPVSTPRRLPPEPTPFVGRAGEAEEIARRLSLPHCRLLTLLGPGGMGKTRLALRAADFLSAQGPGAFLDGVYFVPVANTASAGAFAVTVADVLGLPIGAAAAPDDLVRNYLRPREVLLVLDSVEHLATDDDYMDQIIDLLNYAPLVKLLVTSRARLHLQEEWIYDVAGLDYPAPDDPAPVVAVPATPAQSLARERPIQQALSYAAGQLFVQHAARLQRTFASTPADESAIARICRLLDGQPLGLELAAAWTRAHTCTEIAEHIAHSLDFLDTRLRNVPARQRSLRAVFDYSWSLLSADEQQAMQQLAVFAGPITVPIARSVSQVAEAHILALVGKSLLRADPAGLSFMMHDSVRQYALEKLAETPELDTATWQAYCDHFAAFVAKAAPQLHTAAQLDAQAEIHRERNNIRAAWSVAVQRGWWGTVDRILDGYYWYLWRRGEMHEARTLFAAAVDGLAVDGLAVDGLPVARNAGPLTLARLQSRLADSIMWLGDYEPSHDLATTAQPILRRAQAWNDLAWLCDTFGQLAYNKGQYELAGTFFEEALELFRHEENTEGIAHVLSALANVLCDGEGDYDRARALYAESLNEYQLCGDRYGQAKVTINLGALLHGLGRHAEAMPYYEEGIALCRTLNHRQTLAIVLNNMGQVQKALGHLEEAITLLEESAELRREMGDPRGMVFTLLSLANVAAQQENFAEANAYSAEALQLGLRLGAPVVLADILVNLAALFAGQGQIVHAAQVIGAVIEAAIEGKELRQKVDGVLAELEAKNKAETAAGVALAKTQDLTATGRQALEWLKLAIVVLR